MEYDIIKVVVCGLGAALFAIAVSGCGVTNGSTTLGTTGFLQEVNARAKYGAPMDHHTEADKRKLEEQLRRY